ncbi:glycoside hydrolase [Mycena rebaudengoi]|nr:glycoside hydrolase [Mycena rebaudengoi]
MKLSILAASLASALLVGASTIRRSPIPREIYEHSGYTPEEISVLLQAHKPDDCVKPNTTTRGVIEGPHVPSLKEIRQRNAFVKREGTKLTLLGEPFVFVGPNIYWLGLDENVIPNPSYPSKTRVLEAFAVVTAMKGTVVRGHTLGISVGTPLSLETDLGVWNEKAFESIDFAIMAARLYGVKLVIPLTDNYNWYHGGKYQFIGWHGINFTGIGADITPPDVGTYFYNTTAIVDSFKTYISVLLSHVNQYTGIAYKDDPTIAMWESGNELSHGRFGDGPAPPEWTKDIAQHVKKLSPHVLFADGTYGIYQGTGQTAVREVDIFTDHFYGPNITILTTDIEAVKAVDRAYLIGEFDWTSTLVDAFLSSAKDQGAIGHFFWSLFGKDDACCTYVEHLETFTFHYLRDARTVEKGRTLTRWAAAFRGVESTVPSVPPNVACPQRPLKFTADLTEA